MIQRDYLLRMIEEAAQVVAALIGMRKGGKYDAMLQLLGETYRAYFPFDGELLRNTEEEDVMTLVLEEYGVEEEKLGVLADLLKEEGQYHFDQGQYEQASASFKRGILILNYLNEQHQEVYSFERMNKLDLLRDLLNRSN